jgi:ferredoxin
MDFTRVVTKLDKGYISVNQNLCSWVRYHKSLCRHCAQACPQKSIILDNGIAINHEQCNGCGICLAVCPNGVFQANRQGDREIISWIRGFLEKATHKVLFVQCQEIPLGHKGALLLSCLGRLTENILLATFALGGERIELRKGFCQECSRYEGYRVFQTTLNLTYTLGSFVGILPEQIREVDSFSGGEETKFLPEPSLSRRGFFRAFRGMAIKKTADLLPEPSSKMTKTQWTHYNNPRRNLLLEILPKFTHHYPVVIESSEDLPFAELEITSDCLGCNVCETLCPPGAIKREINDGNITISFYPRLCTNCCVCQGGCLVKAIKTKKSISLNYLFTVGWQDLIQIEERVCKACGAHLLGVEDNYCPSCLNRRNLSTRESILS